jgi:ferredoxin
MRVHLDRERCQGHGRCYVLAPAIFAPDDDGYGTVITADVPAEHRDAAATGAANCPEDAIEVTDR